MTTQTKVITMSENKEPEQPERIPMNSMRHGPTHASAYEEPMRSLVYLWFTDRPMMDLDAHFYYPEGEHWRVEKHPNTKDPPPSLCLPLSAYKSLLAGGGEAISVTVLDDARRVRDRALDLLGKAIG